MNKLVLLSSLLLLLCAGCNNARPDVPELREVQAADHMRFETPTGFVPNEEVIQNLQVDLENHFPIWRDEIHANIHIVIRNKAPNYMGLQSHARLFIYDSHRNVPLYWANIDLAHAKSVGPGTMTIISLPIGGTKDLIVPIHDTQWADISVKTWPDMNLYDFITTGKYLLRLELELFDLEEKPIGTAVSNFVEFTAIRTAPEAIPNSPAQPPSPQKQQSF